MMTGAIEKRLYVNIPRLTGNVNRMGQQLLRQSAIFKRSSETRAEWRMEDRKSRIDNEKHCTDDRIRTYDP
jgi:hypothetical protein